jgi:dTDP-4-dehydrorhamnose reductase
MSAQGAVLIIGAGGRMGAALARRLASSRDVIAFRREHLDVLHPERVRDALATHEFRSVVYTAGITSVDECETDPRKAALSNTDTPRAIAEVCRDRGTRFVHVSTDYVFGGDDPRSRTETDPTEPVNVYGRTKLEGERAVLAVSPDFLVLRVSWLFGPDRRSFPDMILEHAQNFDRVEAVADKHSCPTYSEDLAQWVEALLDRDGARGVVHLCNSGSTSWQAYGQAALDIAASLGVPLRTRVVEGVSRLHLAAFKAVRPEFTSLDTSKFTRLTGITPRPWREALEDYLRKKFAAS